MNFQSPSTQAVTISDFSCDFPEEALGARLDATMVRPRQEMAEDDEAVFGIGVAFASAAGATLNRKVRLL